MRLLVQLLSLLLMLNFSPSPVFGDDLSDAFNKARSLIRDLKPSPSRDSNRSRNTREERRSSPPAQKKPSKKAIQQQLEKQQREKEKQRIKKILKNIDSKMALAKKNPRVTQSTSTHSNKDTVAIATRQQRLDALMDSGDMLAALRLSSVAKDIARKDAKKVRDAMAQGNKPPFKALWDFYKYNRPIALGLVPNENRCAIVMSMTLGVQPRIGEISLQDLGNKKLVKSLVGPIKTMLVKPVKDSDIAKRYYVRVQELANRLKSDLGTPLYLDGKKARKAIAGKKGVLFLENAYIRRGGVTGDHIDLWDSDHIATSSSTPFKMAKKVWFWELR